MAGFEGWISVFEDNNYEGTVFSSPQVLHVDRENLSLGKYIEYRNESVGSGRVGLSSHLVFKEKKPRGGFTYQFRAGDLPKILLCHFQNGTQSGTRYSFYPRTNTLDYTDRGTIPDQNYGKVLARPYTVSVLKKFFDTASNGGTNSFFFKHGICDKLGLQLNAGDDAKAEANFVFRDLDYGTPVANNPGSDGTVGSYSTTPSFQYWSGTVTMDGAAFEISSFEINSDQSIQEYSKLGRQDPEAYQFSGYTLRGNFSFDMPYDALAHVGSMFGGSAFSFVATLYNGTSDRVMIEMPHCKRLPFEFNFSSGNSPIVGKIPFQAFESNGTYPIKITVDTEFTAIGYRVLDGVQGARTVGAMNEYEASEGARTIGDYTEILRA